MKIGKRFNQLSKKEYFYYVDHYKKYTDFNTLGLYRSISENNKLDTLDRIEVRDYANNTFGRTFEFYQLKDPVTYYNLVTLGKDLTVADTQKVWDDIRKNQEKILSKKKIKHRNFGEYSKHNCGYEDCQLNGLMIRQGSKFTESHMYFNSDKDKYLAKEKSRLIKRDRKNTDAIIQKDLDL